MKRWVALCVLAAGMLVGVVHAREADALTGKRIVFLGDSITQAGGYVSFVAHALEKREPGKSFDIYPLGLASETLSGLSEPNHANGAFPRPCLFERLGRLLERVKPDVVFACYGMNDGIYLPLDPMRFAAFKNGVETLVERCRASGVKQIFLITPPIYDADAKPGAFDYDQVLTEYAAWEKSLNLPDVRVIDLHTPMRKARDARDEPFSRDHIHPGDAGHWFMAQTILAALGVESVDQDLKTVKMDPLFVEVDRLRRLRWDRWMKHVGYTREKTVNPEPLGDTEGQEAAIRERIEKLRGERP